MFILEADKTKLTMTQREQMTSGSVNAYTVHFDFSDDWTGLERTAVFKAGEEVQMILLDDTNECIIPWEVLTAPNIQLMAGVYGTLGGDIIVPTVWTSMGTIMEGVDMPEGGQFPPTPELWLQELARKQDKLTGLPSQIVGFDDNGNAVAQDAPQDVLSVNDIGSSLSIESGKLNVVTTDNFDGDNTLPMTAAGVETVVGNIEIILQTI